MITRRNALTGLVSAAIGSLGLSGYAVAVEPFHLVTTRYALTPPGWPRGLKLRLAVLADIHACVPWMTSAHIQSIVAHTNTLGADAILLLGDYVVAHRWIKARVPATHWANALSKLKAPLGVHAVLGNHDWWDDRAAQARGSGPVEAGLALRSAGIPVYENEVIRLEKDGRPFWLAGLADQLALRHRGSDGQKSRGLDDLRGTLAKVTDEAPVILMAHEPDVFPRVPARVALTVSGHTHGGQVRVLGCTPAFVYGMPERYSYGHFREVRGKAQGEHHLIVSGGLGCSLYPVRFGVPPEIVVVELGDEVSA